MLTHLLSFFGIEEVAPIIDTEIQLAINLYVHFETAPPRPT